MKWTPGYRSENVEDRREESDGSSGGGSRGGIKLGCGGFLVLLVLSLLFKKNFFALLDGGGARSPSGSVARAPSVPGGGSGSPAEKKSFDLVNVTLDDVQGTWKGIFPSLGARWTDARLVVFRDAIGSACGLAESATGPFYCPADKKVYVDLAFYDELARRFGAPGDFAQAYVIAHEVGHHVQDLLGIEEKVRLEQQRHPRLANDLSVRLELQADCFAGVWGHQAAQKGVLEKGDVEEGLNAAAAIGDDRLQKMAQGHVSPESFTHGSSQQRVFWFRKGLEAGTPNACDTFAAARP